MPVFQLDERIVFPPVHFAEPSGVLAVGGDLRPERLVLAYASGIFPWPRDDVPLIWHSPDPRYVLDRSKLHVPRSLAKTIRRGRYRVTLDTAFGRVIEACACRPRPGQDGTWITAAMVEGYTALHELGFAHAAEAWCDDVLLGGLYGVSLGAAFFGESMFALEADASKVAFVTLLRQFERWGIELIDAQVHTDHMERFGAEHWDRQRYLAVLAQALEVSTRRGAWRLDDDLSRSPRPALG